MLPYLELSAKSVPINVYPEHLLPSGSQSLPAYSEGRHYLVTTEHEPSAYYPVVQAKPLLFGPSVSAVSKVQDFILLLLAF